MSVQVQRRRDAASFLLTFTGAPGELLVDTTNNRVLVQDGVTAGGWFAGGMSPAGIVQGSDGSNAKHGGFVSMACEEELLTGLLGTTKASTIAFPNPCLILGCSVRVTTTISGATGFNVGLTGATGTGHAFGNIDWFGGPIGVSAGTTNAGIVNPTGNFSSVTVTLTSVGGGGFSAGAVRIQLSYILLTPPTS